MGNPIFKKYNIDKETPLVGGYNNYWKIYKGIHKERKKDASIFVFEKKKIEKLKKDQREEIISTLKKESQKLTKYKHPNILGVIEPLLEDKDTLVFVTEPINYTINTWIETVKPTKLEIKTLLTELCNTINFLHQDAKVIHLSICPENIFIDNQAHIKLSGLNFSLPDPQKQVSEIKLYNYNVTALPNLKYCAPEIIYDCKVGYFSDIFSIGVLIHNVVKKYQGESEELIKIVNNNTINSIDNYKKSFDEIKSKIERENILENREDDEIVKICLETTYEGRPSIKELVDNKWFKDPKLKGLRFIENLHVNDMSKNIEFLNNFPNIMSSFEDKVLEQRILPCFIDSLKYENLISYLLLPIFAICEEKRSIDFEREVWPAITKLLKMKQINAQALYHLLNKTKYISERISNSKFSQTMLSIFCKALDSGVGKIQMAVLEKFEYIIKKIDSLDFKTKFFPRLTKILLNTNSISIKLAILIIFKNFYNLLDQIIINENLLNSLEKVRKNENKGEMCMAVVSVYEEIAKVVSLESIANKVLPNLISILLTGNISKENFELIMDLVQKYLTRIKESREKDLIHDTNNQKLQTQKQNSLKVSPLHHNDFLNDFFVEKNKENGKEKEIDHEFIKNQEEIIRKVEINKDEENQDIINNKITEKIFNFNNLTQKKGEEFEEKLNFPLISEGGDKNNDKEIDKLFNKFVFEDNIYFQRPLNQINKDEIFVGHTGFYNFENNENLFSNTGKEKICNYEAQNGNKTIFPSFDIIGENDKSKNTPTFF